MQKERERIIKLLKDAFLVCKEDYTCNSCFEWENYNGNQYSFCGQLLEKINKPE